MRNQLVDMIPFGLPAGLRMQVIEEGGYTVPLGTVGTLNFSETDGDGLVFITFDNDSMSCGYPLDQLRIVGYSGKKFYKRDETGELVNEEKR